MYVTDVSPWRLELAARLGARTIDLRREPLAEGLARHGANEVDAAVDASGKGAARQGAIQALSKRGVLVCVGHGEGLQLQVSPDLIATERAVVGSEYFRYDEMADNLGILREHRPYLSQIITHRYPVARLKEALDLFHAGECGKVVIEQ